MDGARIGTTPTFGAGRSLEFVATFSGHPYQHIGLGNDLASPPWVMFSTSTGNDSYARTSNGATSIDTKLIGNWLGSEHRFRIDWETNLVRYWIDGIQVAVHSVTVGGALRPVISDYDTGGGTVTVDSIYLSPYATTGSFTSRILDAGAAVAWSDISEVATTPPGTSVSLSVRMGQTPSPDASWTDWVPLLLPGSLIGGTSRYLQYRAHLSTSDPLQTPVFHGIAIFYGQTDTTAPGITTRSPAPGATDIVPVSPIVIGFSELMDPASFTATTVRLRKVGDSTDVPATLNFNGATVTLQPAAALLPEFQYQVTVDGDVTDTAGHPLGNDETWSFTTNWLTVGDQTASDFALGTSSGTTISVIADGEIILSPVVTADFDGA